MNETEVTDDKLERVLSDLRLALPDHAVAVLASNGADVSSAEYCTAKDLSTMAVALIIALGERFQRETGQMESVPPVEIGLGLVLAMTRPQALQAVNETTH